ncbi:type III secretion system chaperone [Ramlibacter sp. AW1]|uniref:Type III secretion system chaperone n=1 Tax=Ramlibacter aurantiacus TaxID=2801330 RepID=A0A936ZQF7_9BURK|nr:type III secretion system chaperone [Ramlibacter aurantiacus]MBL0418814.1 type III secretion system chaperone [Ramlibacter aurantiacus]
MHLAHLMSQLHADLRLPPPQAHAGGTFALRVERVTVDFRPLEGEDAFLMQSFLGTVDLDDSETLAALLEANQPMPGCARPVLGVDLDSRVFLTQRLEADEELGWPSFKSQLEAFVGCAQTWAERLGVLVEGHA